MKRGGTRVGVGTRFAYDGEIVEIVEMLPSTASPKPRRKTFAHSVAHVAGLDTDAIQAMTLGQRHRGTLHRAQARQREERPPWTRRSGSRFCPQCLCQSGGRWQLAWRSTWSFACLTHRCLLADACRARERQRDRYDRAHYGHGHWDHDLPEHDRYPNTIEVNEQGEEQP
jgi:hypothetical protein